MMYVNHESKKLKMHNTMQLCDQCGYQTGGICDMCGNVTPQYENVENIALHLHSGNDIQPITNFGDNDGEIKIEIEEMNVDTVSEESNSTTELTTYDSLGILTSYVSESEHKLNTFGCMSQANIATSESQGDNEMRQADPVINFNAVYSTLENRTVAISKKCESTAISKKCDNAAISKNCDNAAISKKSNSAASSQSSNPVTQISEISITSKQTSTLKNSNLLPEKSSPSTAPKSLGSMISKLVHHCSKCTEKFLELNQCLDHLTKVHSITENLGNFLELKNCFMYQCSLCSQSDSMFFSLGILAKHMQLHGIRLDIKNDKTEQPRVQENYCTLTSKQLKCEVCQVTFNTSTSLSEHTQKISYYVFSMVSRSIFYCKLCNKYFFIFKLFQNHFNRRHKSNTKFLFKEKVQKIFECSVCKATGPKYHLTREKFALHLRIAHGLVLGVTGKSACIASTVQTLNQSIVPQAKILENPTVQLMTPNSKSIQRRQTFNCGICEATFIFKASCIEHLKCEHGLMESEGESKVIDKIGAM